MVDYFCNPQTIISTLITVISVIASGAISFFISKHYYKKANRDNVKSSVLLPMRRILLEQCRDGFPIKSNVLENVAKLNKNFSLRYLKVEERKCLDEVSSALYAISKRNNESEFAHGIFECFERKQNENGNVLKCVPLYGGYLPDGGSSREIIDFDYPEDVNSLMNDLLRAISDGDCFIDYEKGALLYTEAFYSRIRKMLVPFAKKDSSGNAIGVPSISELRCAPESSTYHEEWQDERVRFFLAKESFLSLRVFNDSN